MIVITTKEALAILDELLDARSLTQIQEFVFDRAWAGDDAQFDEAQAKFISQFLLDRGNDAIWCAETRI
jgi:hypothetical protein